MPQDSDGSALRGNGPKGSEVCPECGRPSCTVFGPTGIGTKGRIRGITLTTAEGSQRSDRGVPWHVYVPPTNVHDRAIHHREINAIAGVNGGKVPESGGKCEPTNPLQDTDAQQATTIAVGPAGPY